METQLDSNDGSNEPLREIAKSKIGRKGPNGHQEHELTTDSLALVD